MDENDTRTIEKKLQISLNRGYNLIRDSCLNCPLKRDYDARYYCILGLVDGCTKCRFDYVLDGPRAFYDEGTYWIEAYNDLVRDLLIDLGIRAKVKQI